MFWEAVEFQKNSNIKFENVNYKYDDSNEYMLKNINLGCKSRGNSSFVGKSEVEKQHL